ncbi:UNVERIFIED_CONTAM: Farnesylcysteine lyase [Sesamum angustifolium]|uniref:Farnesylcysteine lyase n=1 Tax=Sesamum angustifolium TaxID=2727405 RepID=A0AAW2NIH5_9LAMI
MNKHPHTALVFCTILLLLQSLHAHSHTVCIIGSGIGGASVAHFLRSYSDPQTVGQITIFERHGVVGGRMATVTIAGETFEAGASILHPKNYHALNYTKYLNLQVKQPKHADDSLSLGIWDGHKFVYKTLNSNSKLPIVQHFVAIANSIVMLLRYGVFSLLRMSSFVEVLSRFFGYLGSCVINLQNITAIV